MEATAAGRKSLKEGQMAEQISADIVVIGSGICGCLAAHRLVTQGASVLILEAGPRLDRRRIVRHQRKSPVQGKLDGTLSFVAMGTASQLYPEGQWLSYSGGALSLSGRIHSRCRRHDLALGGARMARPAERFEDQEPLRGRARLA